MQATYDPLEELRTAFLQRLRKDAAALAENRVALKDGGRQATILDQIRRRAHSLSGAGGIYGFAEISEAAAALEDAIIAELMNSDRGDETDVALDSVICFADRYGSSPENRSLQHS